MCLPAAATSRIAGAVQVVRQADGHRVERVAALREHPAPIAVEGGHTAELRAARLKPLAVDIAQRRACDRVGMGQHAIGMHA